MTTFRNSLTWAYLLFSTIGFAGVNASRVVVDDYMGAYTAVTHLIDTGCRKIAYYGMVQSMEIDKNRFNGYEDALRKTAETESRLAEEM